LDGQILSSAPADNDNHKLILGRLAQPAPPPGGRGEVEHLVYKNINASK